MEIFKLVLTAVFTIVGGIIIYCFTTITSKLFFEPVLALRKTLGDISFFLQYQGWAIHAGEGMVKPERMTVIFEELRTLTARMRSEADGIIGYRYAVWLRLIPPHKDIVAGAGRLIRLSNTLNDNKWDLRWKDFSAVSSLLRIDIGRPSYIKGIFPAEPTDE